MQTRTIVPRLCLFLVGLAVVGCRPVVDVPQRPAKTDGRVTSLKPVIRDNQVTLGATELLRGIPGEGPVRIEDMRSWLEDPANHEKLELQFPAWLASAGSQNKDLRRQHITRAKIELGRQLFFDKRLSLDGTISCASCHDPEHGFTIDVALPTGVGGVIGKRNPPTLLNRVALALGNDRQYWDGSKNSVEDALLHSLADEDEMSADRGATLAKLEQIEGYRLQFEKCYGGVRWEAMGDAMGVFVHNLVTGDSPFDFDWRWRAYKDADADELASDAEYAKRFASRKAAAAAHPMSESARRGEWVFHGNKAWCSGCHHSVNFTDENYHNIGIGLTSDSPDLGRFTVTKDPDDWGAFKTPTIRNAAATAPYMHDGSVKSLEEVVDWYAKDHPNARNLDDRFKSIDELTDADKVDLIEFIKSCAGPLPEVNIGRLPE